MESRIIASRKKSRDAQSHVRAIRRPQHHSVRAVTPGRALRSPARQARPPRLEPQPRGGNAGVHSGQILVVPRANLDGGAVLDELHPVAIPLELIQPVLSFGQPLHETRRHRRDEPGSGLGYHAARYFWPPRPRQSAGCACRVLVNSGRARSHIPTAARDYERAAHRGRGTRPRRLPEWKACISCVTYQGKRLTRRPWSV